MFESSDGAARLNLALKDRYRVERVKRQPSTCPESKRFIALRAAEGRRSTEGDSAGDYRLEVVVGFYDALRERLRN